MRLQLPLAFVPALSLLCAAMTLPSACSSSSSTGTTSGSSTSSSSATKAATSSTGSKSSGSAASSNESSGVSQSSSPSASTSSGGATSGSTGSSSGSSGAACNDLTPQGSTVTLTCANGAAPAAAGGTIVDGTYNLTAAVIYVGTADAGACASGAPSVEATLVVSSSGTVVQVVASTGGVIATETDTLVVSGDQLTGTATCGNSLGTVPFTATSTTLTVQKASSGSTIVEVYTLAS